MKIHFVLFYFFSLYSFLFYTVLSYAHAYKGYDPLIVVVIMVKNEESVICDTLQPFVDGGIDSFFVFDTGSTDETVARVENFFDDNSVRYGYIAQEPFIDFATSRNRALDLAQEKFPQACFMLMPDAEWYIENVEYLLHFCETIIDNNEQNSCYQIRIVNNYIDLYATRLIRCNCGVHFGGVVHEAVTTITNRRVPENIFFALLPSDGGVKKTQERFARDRELLEKELNKNPYHTRTLFYLARTCADMGDLESAQAYFKERVALVGWNEEDFIANLYYARVLESLAASDSRYSWAHALEYYLKAYQMKPWRAEPLVSLADHYIRTNEMSLAFLFAQKAAEICYPEYDTLMIEKYAYDYYRYELLARCAWYIGEFEIGEWAAEMAAEAYPDYEVAQKNLDWYRKRRSITPIS